MRLYINQKIQQEKLMSKNAYIPNKSVVGTLMLASIFLVLAITSTLLIPFGIIFGFIFAVLTIVFTLYFLWKVVVITLQFIWGLPSSIASRVRRWQLSRKLASAQVIRFPIRKA